jgi:MoxR-like ATPase
MTTETDVKQGYEQFRNDYGKLRQALASVLVGQDDVIDLALAAFLGGGHVLLEGPPGVGKTLLGRSLAALLDVQYRRIQFTSDLMPADIIGTYIVMESQGRRRFEFQRGPIFTNLLLADEINRATPKTQAALFEALEERALTVANERYELTAPFFAVATQSLGDIEGTFPVPETQLDRFFFKLSLPPPTPQDLSTILGRSAEPPAAPGKALLSGERIVEMQAAVRHVAVPPDVLQYAVNLVTATRPDDSAAPETTRRLVLRGASLRAGQAMLLAGQVLALVAGRQQLSQDDVRRVAAPALRHRIALNFEGHAAEAGIDRIIQDILNSVRP